MDTIKETVLQMVKEADMKKAEDITVLKLEGISALADYMVIMTGLNPRHNMSLLDLLEDIGEKNGFRVNGKEGHQKGEWILLDFNDIVLHIFTEGTRSYYNLERLWTDAPKMEFELA